MNKIYVTSDLHFCHDKSFLYEPRGFTNVTDMNDYIIETWNNMIDNDDIVYILGDTILINKEKGIEYLNKLNGKLYLVIGNHDTDNKIKLYKQCKNVQAVEFAYRLKYRKWRFFLTHYPSITDSYGDGTTPREHTYNLCGHTHTKNMFQDWDKGCIVHVEMDTNNCKPWDIEEIIDKIKERYE